MSRLKRAAKRYLGIRWGRHRHYVGIPAYFDQIGLLQRDLLLELGLRPDHYLLDVGCGSLCGGKHLIPYLRAGHYFGSEPNRWLLEDGLRYELGIRSARRKRPAFSHDDQFNLGVFDRDFDFILAHSILSHASALQIRQLLNQARRVMKPKARFAASYFKGPRNYRGGCWVYPAVATYAAQKMAEMVSEAGLAMVETAWPHPHQTWVVLCHPEALDALLPSIRRIDTKASQIVLFPDLRGPAWLRALGRRMPLRIRRRMTRNIKLPRVEFAVDTD